MSRRAFAAVIGVMLLGCGVSAAPAPAGPPQAGPERRFSWTLPDGTRFASETTKGRVVVLVFVTTYDLGSQSVLRTVASRARRGGLRAAAIVLEAPAHAALLPAYAEALELPFPAILADEATRAGKGPLGQVQAVPTVVVLDRAGREVWRRAGLVSARELEVVVEAAGRAR